MLDALRKYATGWIAQLFIGLLVLSFAVWGVSDVFNGFRSDSVAQVGSSEVTVAEFQREYDLAVQNLSRQVGVPITQQQAMQMGVPGQVLGRLISQATLDQAAADFGLGLSNEMLGQRIAADPQFFGPDGTFNRGYLSQYLRATGQTEDEFIIARRGEYIRSQIGQAFARGVAAPDAYLRAVHEFNSEARSISYVVLDAPADSEITDPDSTTLAAWYDERKVDWNAPEYRAVSYFSLSPATIARVDDISDEDAKARYDASPQRFSTVERRRVEQIVFTDRAAADAAAQSLDGGKLFTDVLAENNVSPEDADLGLVARTDLADPAIADAAFALASGAVSPVIDGRFGPVIVRVTEIQPAVVTPFEDVKQSLKTEIATERAVAEIGDMQAAIEDARAGGDSLATVAAKYSLPMITVAAVDASGNDEAGNPIADLPAKLVAAAFESDVGLENNPIEPDRNSSTWYEVTAITQPRERPLDEVRDRVVAAWKEQERQRVLDERTAALVRELGTRDFTTVASELLLQVKTAADLTRVTKASGDFTVPALTAIFETGKGDASSADGAQPLTKIVFVVDSITVPPYVADAPELAQVKQQFDNQIVGDLMGMYVAELQNNTDVRFNQPLLQQVLGATPN